MDGEQWLRDIERRAAMELLRNLVADFEICAAAGDPVAYDSYRDAVAFLAKYDPTVWTPKQREGV